MKGGILGLSSRMSASCRRSQKLSGRSERPPSPPQALQGQPGGHVCRQARAWDAGVSPGLEASAPWGRTYVLISHVSVGFLS